MTDKNQAVAKPEGTPFRRARTVGIVSILTLVVAICGYVREATLASRFGLTETMDAYFAAIFIPNILYLVLIAGTLSPVFIPIFLQSLEDGKDSASHVFSVVTNFVMLTLGGLAIIAIVTTHWWLRLLFSGFDTSTLQLASHLSYIIFPAVVLLALAGISTALLNSFNRFALAAFAPALSSVTIIFAALLASGSHAIYVVAFATAIGFLFQFLLLFPATLSTGIRYRLAFDFRHPAIRKVLKVGVPLFLYLAIANCSSFLERNIASRLATGAVSAISYAVRLFALPANFLAAPLAVVAYPHFARQAATNNHEELRSDLMRFVRLVIFAFLPISIWIVANALPISRLLYERGHFRPENSVITSQVLAMYGIGIVPNAFAILALRCFYALQDTTTPLLAEGAELAFYIGFVTLLTDRFGIQGLAATRGLAFFVMSAVLVYVLTRRGMFQIDRSLVKLVAVSTLASLIAVGAGQYLFRHLFSAPFEAGGTTARAAIIAALLILSASLFYGFGLILRIPEAHGIGRVMLDNFPGASRWRKKTDLAAIAPADQF